MNISAAQSIQVKTKLIMEQVFKFTHITVIYHGGKYTLKADKGYLLKQGDGQPVAEVETNDYTRWKAVAAPEGQPAAVNIKRTKNYKRVSKK